MKKGMKAFSALLSMAVLSVPALTFSGCGGTKFTFTKLDGKEEYALTRAEGKETEVEIPSMYEGLPVTKIEEGAFWNCLNVEKLTVPASIQTIVGGAINGIAELKELHVEDLVDWLAIEYEGQNGTGSGAASFALYEGETLVETIDGDEERFNALSAYKLDQNTFRGCTSLKEISLWDSITQIEAWAFFNCTSLEKFVSNGMVTTYDLYFVNCTSLTSVDLKGIRSTGNGGIFSDCTALKEIVFPNTLTTFYSNAAINCSALEKMTFYSWSDSIESAVNSFKEENPTVEIVKVV